MKNLELILFSRLNPVFANLFATMKQQKKRQKKQQKSRKQQKVMKQDKQFEKVMHEFIEFICSRQPAVPSELTTGPGSTLAAGSLSEPEVQAIFGLGENDYWDLDSLSGDIMPVPPELCKPIHLFIFYSPYLFNSNLV